MALCLLFLAGKCDKPKGPEPPDNETELITTVKLNFQDSMNTLPAFSVQWKDLDGVGGNNPTIDTIRLQAQTGYTVNIDFLDESKYTAENITDEVRDEDDEHMICFEPDKTGMLFIQRKDSDGNFEVGLVSGWNALGVNTGGIRIYLKHQPGVKDGTCTPGETDVDVTFPLEIM